MSSSAYKLLENEYASMTPEERKLLIEIFRVMIAGKLATMTPQELQRAQAKMMGVSINDPSAN